jgi:hypothetical protein
MLERHEAWRDLSSRVTLPKPGFLLLDTAAEIHLLHRAHLEPLKERISILREQVAGCQPIGKELSRLILDSADDVRTILEERQNEIDKPETLANLVRQLTLLKELGSEWTLISEQERAFLEREPQARKLQAPDPWGLKEIGLTWKFKEERGCWEPAFPRSRFKNSTLFDHSAEYFAQILKSEAAQQWSANRSGTLNSFLKELGEARKRFELAKSRGEEPAERTLRVEQRAALGRLLKQLKA